MRLLLLFFWNDVNHIVVGVGHHQLRIHFPQNQKESETCFTFVSTILKIHYHV